MEPGRLKAFYWAEGVDAAGVIGAVLAEEGYDAQHDPRILYWSPPPVADIFVLDVSSNSARDHYAITEDPRTILTRARNRVANSPLSWRVEAGVVEYRNMAGLRDGLKARIRALQRPEASVQVDIDRLSAVERENLVFDLLGAMGFRLEFDASESGLGFLVELTRKDPDGLEAEELWLVRFGYDAELARNPYLLNRLTLAGLRKRTQPLNLTLLFVDFDGESSRRRNPPTSQFHKVRIWNRDYLAQLLERYPAIQFKYFMAGAATATIWRKTPEELYEENQRLAERLKAALAALDGEKTRRVQVERDAVWKDVAAAAAHKLGNPVFAIEANLSSLQRRIREGRSSEALEVVEDLRASVAKAKVILDEFKSFNRAIEPAPVVLKPVLNKACQVARTMGVACEIDCPPGLSVIADPDRLAESFDELVANSLHWLDKGGKNRIGVSVTPQDASGTALIHFTDNGPGISPAHKDRIFDAFFTTNPHGTGLGLALVRRMVEGHGGTIREVGAKGDGADFEITLPLAPRRRLKK